MSSPSCHFRWWCALCLLVCLRPPSYAIGVSVVFPGAASQCPNPEDRQFIVSVPTKEPLGLRLGDKLNIFEFISDTQGRSRVVEASGLAEIGDRLVAVNNVTLVGLSFKPALVEIANAALPKKLRFETYDGRCMVTPGSVKSNATSTTNSSVIGDSSTRTDIVMLSLGTKDSDQPFYAVLSAAGQPPGCLFREVVVADPPHACLSLLVSATDKYVIVPSMLGCPTHQKAAFAQEAGAKGVIFVQRIGEKPQQIKLPNELPKPLLLPLAMVSYDSGWQILDTILHKALRTQAPQLRFQFSEECTSDKYTIHPDDDPLQRSVVNRIVSASAGFLSLTVAENASNELNAAAFEFLKPLAPTVSTPGLPLGRLPLFTRVAASVLNACEPRPDKQLSQLSFWTNEFEGAFVAVEWRPSECSTATQIAYFASKKAVGVVFADPSFPHGANQESTRRAAQQSAIPFVFVSSTAMQTIREYGRDELANHVLIEFAGENALQHQWADLELLREIANWPTTKRARERLFYRMLKDQEALRTESGDQLLAKHERQEALTISFETVQRHYQQQGARRSGQVQDV